MRLKERGRSENSRSTQRSSSDHRVLGTSRGIGRLSSLRRVEFGQASSYRNRNKGDVLRGDGLGDNLLGVMAVVGDLVTGSAHSRLALMRERALDILSDGHYGTAKVDGLGLRVAEGGGAGEYGEGRLEATLGCRCVAHAVDCVGGVLCVDADDTGADALE